MGSEKKGNDIMEKYTHEDFEKFEVVDGIKKCPSGEYSGINFKACCASGVRCEFCIVSCFNGCTFSEYSKFGDQCTFVNCAFGGVCLFGSTCNFSAFCKFGCLCKFGDFCKFGRRCKIGVFCKIGRGCEFYELCEFGVRCKFDRDCKFGNRCKIIYYGEFGDGCEFGRKLEFGGRCNFADDCKFGHGCVFGERCEYGYNCNYENGMVVNGRFMCFKNIGTDNREVYLYIDENKKLFLRAGYFFGDLEELNKYCKIHKTDKKTIEQYLLLFETGKKFFEINY